MSKIPSVYSEYVASLEGQIDEKTYPQKTSYQPSKYNADTWVFPLTGSVPRITEGYQITAGERKRRGEVTCSSSVYFPPEKDKKVILYFPANKQTPICKVDKKYQITFLQYSIHEAVEKGHGAYLVNYQSNIEQGPAPTAASFFQDAKKAIQFLVEDKKVLPEHIICYGYSFGVFPAMAAAAFCVEQYKIAPNKVAVDGAAISLSAITSGFWMGARRARHNLEIIPFINVLTKGKVPIVQFFRMQDRLTTPELQWRFAYHNKTNPNFKMIGMEADHCTTVLGMGEILLSRTSMITAFTLTSGVKTKTCFFSSCSYDFSYGRGDEKYAKEYETNFREYNEA